MRPPPALFGVLGTRPGGCLLRLPPAVPAPLDVAAATRTALLPPLAAERPAAVADAVGLVAEAGGVLARSM